MSLFCWTQRKIFCRNFVTRLFWVTIDFHNRKTILWMSMVPQNCSVSNILQIIFLCVQQKKRHSNSLELLEGKWHHFHFWVNYPFNLTVAGKVYLESIWKPLLWLFILANVLIKYGQDSICCYLQSLKYPKRQEYHIVKCLLYFIFINDNESFVMN